MERTLIHEDRRVLAQARKDFVEYMPYLRKIVSEYAQLERGPFTGEVWKQIQENNISQIQKDIRKDLDDQIKKSGITSSVIKAGMIKKGMSVFEPFASAVQALNDLKPSRSGLERIPPLSIKNIAFNDGEFQITEEHEEDILEKYGRIYLETKEAHMAYNQLNQLAKGRNELLKTLESIKFNLKNLRSLRNIEEFFFKTEDDELVINPASIPSINSSLSDYEKREKQRVAREKRLKQRIDLQRL